MTQRPFLVCGHLVFLQCSLSVVLFGKGMKSLGNEALLEEVHHWEWASRSLSTGPASCSILILSVQIKYDLPGPALAAVLPHHGIPNLLLYVVWPWHLSLHERSNSYSDHYVHRSRSRWPPGSQVHWVICGPGATLSFWWSAVFSPDHSSTAFWNIYSLGFVLFLVFDHVHGSQNQLLGADQSQGLLLQRMNYFTSLCKPMKPIKTKTDLMTHLNLLGKWVPDLLAT